MKYGIFVVSLCAMSGAAILGCSASVSPGGSPDAGTVSDGRTDARSDQQPPSVDALASNVYLVNAATGLGDIRLCFLPDDKPAQPSDTNIPQTNYAGLAVGGAAFFRNSSDVRNQMLKPFAVTAEGLGEAEYGRTPYSCNELSTNPIIKKTPIAPVQFSGEGPAVFALVGCPMGVGDAVRCGPTFDATNGNLRFVEVPVTGNVPANAIGAYAINLSPSIEKQLNGMTARGQLGSLADPCTGTTTIGQGNFAIGATQPTATTVALPTAYDTDGFAMCVGAQSILARSYAAVQQATDPTSVPSEWFEANANYVFAVVGDTTVQSGPEAVHALAIRFDATK